MGTPVGRAAASTQRLSELVLAAQAEKMMSGDDLGAGVPMGARTGPRGGVGDGTYCAK